VVNFVINANDPNEPLLRKFIDAVKEAIGDDAVLNAILKNTGLTKEELFYALKDNQGPILQLADLTKPPYTCDYEPNQTASAHFGPGSNSTFKNINSTENGIRKQETLGKDIISLEISEFTLKAFTKTNPQPHVMFYVAITILHELGHYGELHSDGEIRNQDYSSYSKTDIENLQQMAINEEYGADKLSPERIEPGQVFEYNLFKYNININNIKSVLKEVSKNHETRQKNEKSERGKSVNSPIKSPRNM
jgi:hypothetical protein